MLRQITTLLVVLLLSPSFVIANSVTEHESQESGIQINALEYVNIGNDILKKVQRMKIEQPKHNQNIININNQIILQKENDSIKKCTYNELKNESKEKLDITKPLDRVNTTPNNEEDSKLNRFEKREKKKYHNIPGFVGPLPKPPFTPTTKVVGPEPNGAQNINCEEINKNARFNPFSLLEEKLFAFFYWAPSVSTRTIEFVYGDSALMQSLRDRIDRQVANKQPVDWSRRHVVLLDHIVNTSAVLVERNERGLYWIYPIYNDTKAEIPYDLFVQFKQSSDGKYLLMVLCEAGVALLFSRFKDIPRKNKMADAINSMGLIGLGGHSYLYQGHQWMPTEEMTEEEYWAMNYGSIDNERHPELDEEIDDWEPEEEIDIKDLNIFDFLNENDKYMF